MLPLANRRILITRAKGQASALATQLEALGATTILIPTIEIAPPFSYAALDSAIKSAETFDWLVFTSANAVQLFTRRAEELCLQPRPPRIAVIGLATARAVHDSGLADHVDLMPQQATAEALAEVLTPLVAEAKVLLVRAAAARDILPQALAAVGTKLTIAEAYRTIVPKESVDLLRQMFMTAPPDAITFTSASTAQNLMALLNETRLGIPSGVVTASIGPITSDAMRTLGLEPTLESPTATIDSLVGAIVSHFAPGSVESV